MGWTWMGLWPGIRRIPSPWLCSSSSCWLSLSVWKRMMLVENARRDFFRAKDQAVVWYTRSSSCIPVSILIRGFPGEFKLPRSSFIAFVLDLTYSGFFLLLWVGLGFVPPFFLLFYFLCRSYVFCG
ncbi:hypothetical protein BJ508DRAFT_53124 [Ascobolus immersus RN42]|uniref:Uncharacterized protein n=1 Tax=Ascobolus immersus RN42 TaxID=1160509 RepID=A0A3N4HKA9_ASCIM|nr:hypothetical protein BJ508DRAFT_53124 [Ascobolus immersus RN42]